MRAHADPPMRGERHRLRTKPFWVRTVGLAPTVKGAPVSQAGVPVCNLGFPGSHECDLSFLIPGSFSLALLSTRLLWLY